MAKSMLRGPDRYEINARLKPALFTAMPLLILPATWLPKVWTALGGLAALMVTCGLTVLMAQLARHRGRALQRRWADLGPECSARLLSHADVTIDPLTKARYHRFLASKDLAIPTVAEETVSGLAAYRACVTWLLANTRDKDRFHLLAEENIGYGYRRNLLALKPIALFVLGVALTANSTALWVRWPIFDTRYWVGWAVEFGFTGLVTAWVIAVRPAFVADASQSFAERLLACCDELHRGDLAKSKANQLPDA